MKITLNENSSIEEIKKAEKFIGEKVVEVSSESDECNEKREDKFVYIVTEIDAKARTINGDIIDPNSGHVICKNQRIGNFTYDWEVTIETVEDSDFVAPAYTAIVYDCNGDKSHFEGNSKKGILKEIGEFVLDQVEYMGQCTIELAKRGSNIIDLYKLPAGHKTAIFMDTEEVEKW